jgi:16S rRNA (guanine527-N7)-methyltransferase
MTTTAPAFGPHDFARLTGADEEAMARLSKYETLLRAWNEHTNLIAPSTVDAIWERHFWDSAQLLPLIPPQAKSIVDLGAGAGFPGLVLAALLQGESDATIHLVDATQKKCRFLTEASAEMGLRVQVHWDRAETMRALSADVVTARAVAALDGLFALVERHLKPDGVALLLKGARANEELTAARRAWDFEVNKVPSRSDSAGMVLCVTGLRRCPNRMKRS